MIKVADIDLTDLISYDERGYAYAPNIYQIQDKDVALLYQRDKGSPGDIDGTLKLQYIKEAGVVYYLGDPKSPANQMGYSRVEAIKLAKSNYDLDAGWEPDDLILRLAKRYKECKMGVAGEALEAALRALHNSTLACNLLNNILSERMLSGLTDEASAVISTVTELGKIINILPNQIKTVEDAKQNLLLEKQTKYARGKVKVTNSMDASNAKDIMQQAEAERKKLGLTNSKTVNPQTYELTK